MENHGGEFRTERRLASVSSWALLGGAALLPFVIAGSDPLRPWLEGGAGGDDSDVLPKVLFARVLVLALAALWLLRGLAAGRLRVRRTPLDLPVLAFVASALLSTLLAENVVLSLFGSYTRYEGFVEIATCAALAWLTVQHIDTVDPRSLTRALVASGTVQAGFAVVQSVATTVEQKAAGAALGTETSTTFGGIGRAVGTMANANNLAILLAMLLPLALEELVRARSGAGRVIAGNAAVVMGVGLAFTEGRAAWLGAGLGCGVVLAPELVRLARRAGGRWIAAACVAGLALVALVGRLGVSIPAVAAVTARLGSLTHPTEGSGGTRLHIWHDAVAAIAGSPLVGHGLDSFGLVDGRYATGDWTPGFIADKAHSDVLQVGVTQGLLGIAAYLAIVAVVAVVAWRTRGDTAGRALAGAVAAYFLAMQLNFAWAPVTLVFWVVLGAGAAQWGTGRVHGLALSLSVRARSLVAAMLVVATVAATLPAAVRPLLANIHYSNAVAARDNGDYETAATEIAAARSLDGTEAEYDGLAGSVALRGDATDVAPEPARRDARDAYAAAQAHGTIYADIERRLAQLDLSLARPQEAVVAARLAVQLAPFDPTGAALLKQAQAARR